MKCFARCLVDALGALESAGVSSNTSEMGEGSDSAQVAGRSRGVGNARHFQKRTIDSVRCAGWWGAALVVRRIGEQDQLIREGVTADASSSRTAPRPAYVGCVPVFQGRQEEQRTFKLPNRPLLQAAGSCTP